MPAALAVYPDSQRSPRLLTTFVAASGPIGRAQLVAKLDEHEHLATLREQTRQDRTELAKAAEWLAERVDQPVPHDIDRDWLAQAADEARRKESMTAQQFHPVIEALNELLVPTRSLPAEIEKLVREGISILEGWLAFYRGLHEMLARQLAERAPASGVLRARPVAGEIDYAELSRGHIARYPKIRAALAK